MGQETESTERDRQILNLAVAVNHLNEAIQVLGRVQSKGFDIRPLLEKADQLTAGIVSQLDHLMEPGDFDRTDPPDEVPSPKLGFVAAVTEAVCFDEDHRWAYRLSEARGVDDAASARLYSDSLQNRFVGVPADAHDAILAKVAATMPDDVRQGYRLTWGR